MDSQSVDASRRPSIWSRVRVERRLVPFQLTNMSLKNYGVLKGRPIARRVGTGASPHYQVHLIDDDQDYRIAVNVKSQKSPSELLYLIVENYTHPLVDEMKELPAGFTGLESRPGGVALDFIRANLFKPG